MLAGRFTGPFSSLEDALKIRLTTPSTREQNDISNIATAAYVSGSNVTSNEQHAYNALKHAAWGALASYAGCELMR